MARTNISKNGRVSITGLTLDERDILWECLTRAQDAMEWNEKEGVATDGERFIWEIDNRKEFDVLQNLII